MNPDNTFDCSTTRNKVTLLQGGIPHKTGEDLAIVVLFNRTPTPGLTQQWRNSTYLLTKWLYMENGPFFIMEFWRHWQVDGYQFEPRAYS